MSELSIIRDDDGYWLNIKGEKSALVLLERKGPIVSAAVEEAFLHAPDLALGHGAVWWRGYWEQALSVAGDTVVNLRTFDQALRSMIADLAAEEKRSEMYANIVERSAKALGKPSEGAGSSRHDIPECIEAKMRECKEKHDLIVELNHVDMERLAAMTEHMEKAEQKHEKDNLARQVLYENLARSGEARRTAKSRIAVLVGALGKYGKHDETCNAGRIDVPCICGLDAAIAGDGDFTWHDSLDDMKPNPIRHAGDSAKEGV